MSILRKDTGPYGLLAEFENGKKLVRAVRLARESGYARVDAFSPFPMHELDEALGLGFTWVPFIVLIGAILGGSGGFFLQWYSAVIDYPWIVGGKPLNSWPMFIPITFEMTVLGAGLFGVVGMLLLNKLPQLYHPLFNSPEFQRASIDRFFLCIEARDPKFELQETRRFLEELGAKEVKEVER